MKKFKSFWLFSLIIFLLISPEVFSKENNTSPQDSLRRITSSGSPDTSKVNALNEMTRHFYLADSYDSAMKYCNEAITLAESLDFKNGLSNAISNKGIIYFSQGSYSEAMNYHLAALKINEVTGNKKALANSYNSIANIYHMQGDYPNALKNQFMALRLREEIDDKEHIAWSYNNIGVIYRMQGDFSSALKNYFAAMKTLEELGDKKNVALLYNNIANIYSEQRKFQDALNNYFLGLKIRESLGDKRDIGTSYNNIGDVFCDIFEKDSLTKEVNIVYADNKVRTIPRAHWLDTAITLQFRALAINKELDDKYYSIYSLSGIGRVNFLNKNYPETIKYYKSAYAIAEKMNAVELQKEIAKYLSDSYSRLNDYKNGMNWYVKFSEHKDSLFNEERTQDLTRTQMKYEFEKKEGEAKAIQDRKDALSSAELGRQKKMRNIFLGGFALVLLFAGVFFYQRNDIRKEKIRSDNLLLNILPSEIASELKQTGSARTRHFDQVTVMFADFVDFTVVSSKISPEMLVEEIHACFSGFDNIIQKYKIEKIKTIGDAYLCASGLPVTDPNHATNMVLASLEIRKFIEERKKIKELRNEIPFELRIGIHTGPVVAGIVGIKKYAYDIWGDTVNIAARMEQNSEPGKINISNSTHEFVKDNFSCVYRGKIAVKNRGDIDMYFLEK